MELIFYIVFVAVVVSVLVLWTWVMRTVARTTALLEEATSEIEAIAEEVRTLARDFVDVTDELEQARLRELYSPKNRRKTDRKDN